MEGSSLVISLLMGLTGSLHCVGMCGPIMLVMPFHAMTPGRKWAAILLYHFGRVSVYALMGVVLYSFKSVFQPQVQQYISIALGMALLVAGLLSFFPGGSFSGKLPWSGYVQRRIGRFMAQPSLNGLFITGVLNGLLPCGLVYMALAASVNAATPAAAALSMYAFGIGTMPMLISITILKNKVSFLSYTSIRKVVPMLMLFFGFLFLLRGFNLGIPYLSPKLEVTKIHEVKASCCHKN
ncbi:MAG: sulfite exporter TauE/SafE family protein [Flavipsychrobacter sp.]|nr:sulfite exporter TauE/SafE family protein [Flavipsychrobacter sp.]